MFSLKLRKWEFKLSNKGGDQFLNELDEYLTKAPSNSSPGNPEYASGNVNLTTKTFQIDPRVTFRRKELYAKVEGTFTTNEHGHEQVLLTFKSPIIPALLGFIFYVFLSAVALSKAFDSLRTPAEMSCVQKRK